MENNNILYRQLANRRLDSLTALQVAYVLASFAGIYFLGAFITIIF